MKRGILLFLFLLALLSSISAIAVSEKVSLGVGESRLVENVNFTLLRTSTFDDKVVMCVNNRQVIISDRASLGSSRVEVLDIFSGKANLELEVFCEEKCKCTDECLNDACLLVSAERCFYNKDCDDTNPDTVDVCVSNVCEHRSKLLSSCSSDADCDDGNECTADQCSDVLKKCVHEDIENCTQGTPKEEQPSQPSQPSKLNIPTPKLSTYILLALVALLLVALLVKRLVR